MGGGQFLDTGITCFVHSMEQEITTKEFSSLRTVKDTAEVFAKPFLREYVVILWIVRPNPNSIKKALFLERMYKWSKDQ